MNIESDYSQSITHNTNDGHSDNFSLSDTNSFVSANASDFSLVSGASSTNHDMYSDILCSRSQESGICHVDNDCESSSEMSDKGPETDDTWNVDFDADMDLLTIPRGKSIAHNILMGRKAVFVSFDMETGGEYCGIVQISAQILRLESTKSSSSNTSSDWLPLQSSHWVKRKGGSFNHYVNPGENVLWDEDMCHQVHGLHRHDQRIMSADKIDLVWNQFTEWIDEEVTADEVAILVAYNGASCDLCWIWKLTQSPFSKCVMPAKIKLFLDPLHVIKHYKTCKINSQHSKLETYELGSVWRYLFPNKEFPGSLHDSMTDAVCQSDLIAHVKFVTYINRSQSIRLISDMFRSNERKQLMNKLEPVRPVHGPWREVTLDDDVKWSPNRSDSYSGSQGGPKAGPSNDFLTLARTATSLHELFTFVLPIAYFENIAKSTNSYCYEEYVCEQKHRDRDGCLKKKTVLVQCKRETNGSRFQVTSKKKRNITAGYIMAWHGINLIFGGHFGSNKGDTRKFWRNPPHGIVLPYVRNSMTKDSYEFLRRYIHFADNSMQNRKGECGYDPLLKVRAVIDAMMKGLRKIWTAGKYVTIDESMIKYMGRAISYVQYMPAKPIKHGIKVFCVCCAESGILLGFEVYCGKDFDVEGTAEAIVSRLIEDAGLHRYKGRVLFTDNWYTSVKLVKRIFEQYRWTFCGTLNLTSKKVGWETIYHL
jgi:hypothetical protein